MTPKIGHVSGGKVIYLFADHFSNITNPKEVMCQFTQVDDIPDHKIYPKQQPAIYFNETTMACRSPPGFQGGDQVWV